MNEREKAFMEELRILCNKYGVDLDDYDGYDGEERFTGTDWYFQNHEKGEDRIYLSIHSVQGCLY